MYQENMENIENLVEEEDTREALPEPSAEDQESDGAQDTNDKITNEEILQHCTCHIADGHIQ